MENKLPGVGSIAALMLAVLLACWLGIAGPILSDAQGAGVIATIKDWQTLVGVAGAFGVAWIAVRPVWRQVEYQGAQAAIQLLQILEEQSRALQADKVVMERFQKILFIAWHVLRAARLWRMKEPKGQDLAILDREFQILIEACDGISAAEWARFVGRSSLPERDRESRSDLREQVDYMRLCGEHFISRVYSVGAIGWTTDHEVVDDVIKQLQELVLAATNANNDIVVQNSVRASELNMRLRDIETAAARSLGY